MISSVVSDRTIVIAPSLRHVKALNAVLGEDLPSEIVKFEKGDNWDLQPDNQIIYIQVENPVVEIGRKSFTPAVNAIEEIIPVQDLFHAFQAFIITDTVVLSLSDSDDDRYARDGKTSTEVLAAVSDHLAQPEG